MTCEHPDERQTLIIRCACGAEKPATTMGDAPILPAQLLEPGSLVLDAVEAGTMTVAEAHALARELLTYKEA